MAQDICEILENPNVSRACNRLKAYEKGIHNMNTPGGNQDILCISESGLYRLILTSRKPQAEPLQDWVCQEVLPSIRKNGFYAAQPEDEKLLSDAILMIDAAFSDLNINPGLVAGLKINALAKLKPSLEPAAEESRKLLAATTTIPDRLLTPTEIGKELGISGRAANKLLVEKGLQIKNPDKKSKGAPTYLPTERGHEFCDLTIATGKSGDNTSYQSLKWYPSVVRVIEG